MVGHVDRTADGRGGGRMVSGLRTMVKEAHINDADVRTEKFSGY